MNKKIENEAAMQLNAAAQVKRNRVKAKQQRIQLVGRPVVPFDETATVLSAKRSNLEMRIDFAEASLIRLQLNENMRRNVEFLIDELNDELAEVIKMQTRNAKRYQEPVLLSI